MKDRCRALWAAAVATLCACGGDGRSIDLPPPRLMGVDFGADSAGWTGATADYGPTTAPVDALHEASALPAPLSGQGFRLSGTNRSDDLFVYIVRRFDGFVPGVRYQVQFEVQFASRAASGCVGVGGAPGESVWVHAGATPSQPQTVLDGGRWRVDIDRGNQATGGTQGVVLGDIANGRSDCGRTGVFTSKRLPGPHAPHQVQADSAGRLWLHLGMDSGFESYSEIHLQRLTARFSPAP
jgi:hypothetical protein